MPIVAPVLKPEAGGFVSATLVVVFCEGKAEDVVDIELESVEEEEEVVETEYPLTCCAYTTDGVPVFVVLVIMNPPWAP